jgi:hypothetical protein
LNSEIQGFAQTVSEAEQFTKDYIEEDANRKKTEMFEDAQTERVDTSSKLEQIRKMTSGSKPATPQAAKPQAATPKFAKPQAKKEFQFEEYPDEVPQSEPKKMTDKQLTEFIQNQLGESKDEKPSDTKNDLGDNYGPKGRPGIKDDNQNSCKNE